MPFTARCGDSLFDFLQRQLSRIIENLSFPHMIVRELCFYIKHPVETSYGVLHTGDALLSGHILNGQPNLTDAH